MIWYEYIWLAVFAFGVPICLYSGYLALVRKTELHVKHPWWGGASKVVSGLLLLFFLITYALMAADIH